MENSSSFMVLFYFNHVYVKSRGSLFTLGKIRVASEDTGPLPLGPPSTWRAAVCLRLAVAGLCAPQREESELFSVAVPPVLVQGLAQRRDSAGNSETSEI